ncbi:TolC family outer membrane protein [Ideonella sp. DXS29W]|uniref:TolC family outer membrane protein n=1 Tax=Ideonella lacteola TaxID=2984193 RepID=A0ABU9BI92_9BURK
MQAWQGALQQSPDLAVARAAREAGAARAEQASALWRPTVALQAGVSYAGSESNIRGASFTAPGLGSASGVAFDTSVSGGAATQATLAIRQPLFSRERSARAEALEQAAQAAEYEWAQAEQEAMLRTAEVYFAAALAAERLRLVERQQQAVDQAAQQARDRFRLGDRPVTDVHEAESRAAGLQAERVAAQTQLELARQALSDMTGQPVTDEPVHLPGELAREALSTLPDWLARAEQRNPMLMRAQTHWRTAQAQSRATGSALSPTVDAVAQIGRERWAGDGASGSASQASRQHAVGLQITVPLYTGGMRSAQAAEARALVDQARAELDRARLQVAQQTRAAWLDLAVGHHQTSALKAAREASLARLDATRVGLQAGDRTTLDLLNAENDAASAELALSEARVRLISRRLTLAALAGELDDTALQQANAQLQPSATRR